MSCPGSSAPRRPIEGLWTELAIMAACLCFATCVQVHAADPPRPVTVDDYFSLGILNEVAISSAAQSVAYTEGRWEESTNDRKTDIWVVPYSGGLSRKVTFDRAGYDTLHWSNDGKFVYCASNISLSGQPASRQVLRVAVDGSGTAPVSRADGGVDSFQLAPNGNAIFYTKSSEDDAGDWSAVRSKFPKLKYGTRKRAKTTFHRIDLATWRTTQVANYAGAVDSFAVSPDEKRIAMVTGADGAVITMEGRSELTILDLATGNASDLPDEEWREKAPSPFGRLSSPRWSSNGSALAFAIGFDAYPSEILVASWKGAGAPDIRKVRRPGTMSLHGGVDGSTELSWKGSSHDLCFLGDDRARIKVYCAKDAPNGGPVDCMIDGDVVVDAFSWDRDGKRCAAIKGSPDRMHDVFLYGPDSGEGRRLTEINAHAKAWALPRISIVKWKGKDGKPVEGLLELPPDYKPGTRLPTIVNLHGGPTSAWPYNMVFGYFGSVIYASQGYAYFSPNYRGSTGYGDDFITDLVLRENDVDVSDILNGVDQLIAEGVADEARIGVGGWSNGGFLTNCLISKTDRFKAASSGAGIVDQTMEWGINDEPAFPLIFSGGAPWQVPDVYRRTSPIYQFGQVKTPTLFHVGENDPRCPKGQSEAAHRALKENLKIETELIVYPGEAHGLAKYASRKAKFTWDLAWFDHFLKGAPKP